MPLKYGTPVGPSFEGGISDGVAPLRQVWRHSSPSFQFTRYTGNSPAVAGWNPIYPGLEFLKNVYVVWALYGIEVFRKKLVTANALVILPEEISFLAYSLWVDSGVAAPTVSEASVSLYAPEGVGYFWNPRTIIWVPEVLPNQ